MYSFVFDWLVLSNVSQFALYTTIQNTQPFITPSSLALVVKREFQPTVQWEP